MKAIEWRFGAFLCVIVAVLAWGCSGEDGKDPKGSNTGGEGATCTFSNGCLEGGAGACALEGPCCRALAPSGRARGRGIQ